ncbi:MAG: hypothetical protein ACOC44_17660 [Promethearchaeia archaeon]
MENINNLEAMEVAPVNHILKGKKAANREADLPYYKLINRLGFISQDEYKVIESMLLQKEVDLTDEKMRNILKGLVRKQLIKKIKDSAKPS